MFYNSIFCITFNSELVHVNQLSRSRSARSDFSARFEEYGLVTIGHLTM